MNTGRILVASSNPDERGELRAALELEGHDVAEAATAYEAIQKACAGPYDVLLVDSVVDGMAAYELCRAIRTKSDVGIIVLTNDDDRQSRIDALNAGADDYLPSPFVLRELLARVRAVLRRVTPSEGQGQIVLHDRAIDWKSYKIRGPGSRVSHLTPKEFRVLQCLVAHSNKVFTHQSLAQIVWQRDGGGELEYVRVVIRQLRRKLEPIPDNPRYILTERSVGYRFHMPLEGQGPSTELSSPLPLAG